MLQANIYIYTYIPWIYFSYSHLTCYIIVYNIYVLVYIYCTPTFQKVNRCGSGFRHPQNNRNERNIRIITGWLGRGSNGMLENSLDCLYLQNENDEHRRFVWSCESFIFWDLLHFACFCCAERIQLQPSCDGFVIRRYIGLKKSWDRRERGAEKTRWSREWRWWWGVMVGQWTVFLRSLKRLAFTSSTKGGVGFRNF